MKQKPKRILVVEDEKDLAAVVRQLLEREGYIVDQAHDGVQGLEMIRMLKPDLVLLDVMLPRMDGRDILKILKADVTLKNIPVLVMSARSEEWDKDLGLELGAAGYVEKPFNSTLFVKKVNELLNKKWRLF